jgi:hypothetical protein
MNSKPTATSGIQLPGRPKGMPKKEYKKFLDFAISTTQYNSGTQQYGAGQKMGKSRTAEPKMRRKRAARTGPRAGGLLEEREVVMQVNGSTSFEVTAITIQPGLAEFLPWGSKPASQYERYVIEDLRFIFVPEVSQYNADGAKGRICLACDYDAAEGPPESMAKMESYDPHSSGMAYGELDLHLDAKRLTPVEGKFIRNGLVAGDIKTYDAGVFYFAAAGTATAGLIGEIHVVYKIRPLNPRLQELSLAPCRRAWQAIGTVDVAGLGVSTTWLNPAWSTNLSDAFDFTCLPVVINGFWLTLPRGNYRVSFATVITYTGTEINGGSSIDVSEDVGGYDNRPFSAIFSGTLIQKLIPVRHSAFVRVVGETGNVALKIYTDALTAASTWGFDASQSFVQVEFLA